MKIDLNKEYKLTLSDILVIIFLCLGFGCGIGLFLYWLAWAFFAFSIAYICFKILALFVTYKGA